MRHKYRKLLYGLRFLLLKFINVILLGNRIQFNGFVSLGPGVEIIVEPGASIIFKGRCALKARTIIFVKKDASLIFGNNSSTGHDTEISVGKLVEVGADVIMGAYTYISDSNHRYDLPHLTVREQGMDLGTVEIGSDVWIGRGAMVLKGAKIGNRTVVAAGAIVTRKFDDNVIIGGVPAKILKENI